MKWIVYTEVIDNGTITRWYYCSFDNKKVANEVALHLNSEDHTIRVFHCVCSEEEAKGLNIRNIYYE